MIKLFAPKQLQLSIEQFIRSSTRDISKRSIFQSRSFVVPLEGEKSFANFHQNRSANIPFYSLGNITLLRAFPDPLGKYKAYYLYLVSESADIIHEMQYVDDPDDYLDIDNPYRGFDNSESNQESTNQPSTDQSTVTSENE